VRSDMEERAMERQTIIYVTARQESGGKNWIEGVFRRKTHTFTLETNVCVCAQVFM